MGKKKKKEKKDDADASPKTNQRRIRRDGEQVDSVPHRGGTKTVRKQNAKKKASVSENDQAPNTASRSFPNSKKKRAKKGTEI